MVLSILKIQRTNLDQSLPKKPFDFIGREKLLKIRDQKSTEYHTDKNFLIKNS